MEKKLPKIFILEDDPIFTKFIQAAISSGNEYDITCFESGTEMLNKLHESPDIITIDFNLPDMNGLEILQKVKAYNPGIFCIIVSGQQELENVVQCFKAGARDYIVKSPENIVYLANSVSNFAAQVNLRYEIELLKQKIIDRDRYRKIIGESKAILEVLKLLQKVEKTNMTVLITGESGTGKELIANALHYNSPRSRNPFVAVNMAAIPEDLIESELFGHEKGAFTGADYKRIGKFEEANGGTIFLDEIGEMSYHLQSRLLRVLQEKKLMRVGSNKEIDIDVRVVAATNRDLAAEVKSGKFREDLYYRLQGFLISLPPLRERDNDTIILSRHFLSEFCKENRLPQKTIAKEVYELFTKHTWQGNIRELKATIERAALISESDQILAEDIIFSH